MPNAPALAGIEWGQEKSPSASFIGESWGYAGFLFCCSCTTPGGLGPQPCPSQFLCRCPSTTPSLKCHFFFSSSKAQFISALGLVAPTPYLIYPLQPCKLPPSPGQSDCSCFNSWMGLKPRAGPLGAPVPGSQASPLTKFEVGVGGKEPGPEPTVPFFLHQVPDRICDGDTCS